MGTSIFFKRSTSQRKMSTKNNNNNNNNNNKIMRSTKKTQKKKKKKEAKIGKETTNPCALEHGYFFLLYIVRVFLSIFSPILGRKHFGGVREKILRSN